MDSTMYRLVFVHKDHAGNVVNKVESENLVDAEYAKKAETRWAKHNKCHLVSLEIVAVVSDTTLKGCATCALSPGNSGGAETCVENMFFSDAELSRGCNKWQENKAGDEFWQFRLNQRELKNSLNVKPKKI